MTAPMDEVCHWKRLTPDLIRKIASYLHPNDVIEGLKLADSWTADALEAYHTFVLSARQPSGGSVADPYIAETRWPADSFVLHWGRPEPWRALSLRQRRRLLCLAAGAHHPPSLDAALARCGLKPDAEVMAAAAAAGNLHGCKLLLDRGCKCWLSAVRAAAREGHIPVLRLLMDRFHVPWNCDQADVIAEAAHGACMGGQAVTLAWLRHVHGYRPVVADADAAARAGQVELLEQLLPELESQLFSEDPSNGGAATAGGGLKDPTGAGPALPAAEYRRRAERLSLMCNILRSCPADVAQRHYDTLWVRGQWPTQPAAGGGGGGGGASNGDGSGGGAAALQTSDAYTAALAGWDAYRFELLAAAVSSRTPCWPAKLDFLQARFGLEPAGQLPRAWWGMAASLASAACWPREGCRQRLKRLRHLGVQLDDVGVFCSLTEGGHVDALRYLWDECGVRPAALSDRQVCGSRTGEPAVLRFLHERGYRFGPQRVAWEALHGASAETLLFLAEVAQDRGGEMGGDREAWSMAFRRAAMHGSELRVLQALRRRGADVNLAAVACGCGESHLEWAVAELRAARRLSPLDRKEAREVLEDYGNAAAMRWLQAHGLLPPVHPPPPRRRQHRCCVIS